MAWVKIDDTAPEHPKLLALDSPAACWLWVCGLAYCNRQKRRDGFIPAAKVPLLYPMPNASKQADRLVEAGLWERVEGGYQVHDYHEYQPDTELSNKRAEAGRAGGIKSGAARRSKPEASASSNCNEANEAPSRPDPVPIPSRPEENIHTHAPAIHMIGSTQPVIDALVEHGGILAPPRDLIDAFVGIGTAYANATGDFPIACAVLAVSCFAKLRASLTMPPGWNAPGIQRNAGEIQRLMAGHKPTNYHAKNSPAKATHPDSISDLEKSFES